MESTRLLLHSNVPDESGQLGRNLMFLTLGTGTAVFKRSEPRIAGIDWRQPFVNRSFQDLYFVDGDNSNRRKGGTATFLFPHANPIYTAERFATLGSKLTWGRALKAALRRHYRDIRELEFEVFTETLPTAGSRVTLDPTVKDRRGLAVARFTEEHHALDVQTSRTLVARGLDVLRAMGGEEVTATRVGSRSYYLQSGTCRFGDDPKLSVLDRDCRFHAVPNLFVTDGSFMPTSGGVSHTLTIQANALRVGERIVALGRSHQLFRRGGTRGTSR